MLKDELLSQFLGKHPQSSHYLDRERFVKYALACASENCCIDIDAMRKAGLDENQLRDLQMVYEYIRIAHSLIT